MTEPIIVVRREILCKAYADPDFGKRLNHAQTLQEIASILEEYCEKNGYKTKRVNLK